KYHPHGDAAIYDTLVRMAQDFSLRYTLVDGQGNFGSIDGDPPAAMRYTEARLSQISEEMIADIEKETVKFVPNYDGSLTEPSVLPARLPNLLINGSNGIAVGMATNIPTHNLSEVCDAIIAVIENPQITPRELMRYIKGPDFPTGGIIRGKQGIKDYFETGKGSIKIQARTEIEEIKGGKQAIIISEIPYQVNKTNLIEHIANLVKEKKITDISDIRDESDRRGMRIVIEVKRDGNAQIVLNQLLKHTSLETTFGVIMLAIVDGRPKILTIKEVIDQYIKHRKQVIYNRTRYDLNKALERAHILEGYLIALKNIDEVVEIIKKSKDANEAKEKLIKRFGLSEKQAQAILDMRLHQLTRLEVGQVEEEYKGLLKLIEELRSILKNPSKILKIIVDELRELKDKYGDKRRTEITSEAQEFDIEDLITKEDVVITITHSGYIKRIPIDTYKTQGRGGKGVIGSDLKEEDFVDHLFIASTHSTILLFTTRGKVYALKGYEIPEAPRSARGKAIINLLPIKDEKISSIVAINSFDEKKKEQTYLFMATRKGYVKKTPIFDFANIRKTGIAAITLEDGDILTGVAHTDGTYDIILGTKDGMSIRFSEKEIRPMGRTAKGVRGIKLAKDDIVVGMEAAPSNTKKDLLTVCENGFGKRTSLDEYRNQHRGGSGIITIKTTERNGNVVGIHLVDDKDDLMIITEKGKIIRINCKDISVVGRNTQGIRLVRLEDGDKVSSVEPVVNEEDTEKELEKNK
ncbi:MAG: DNA gyrase subunit A, partial [Elusimicrobiales bacterium]|nr:DNA gyrase subunit A [Elusimicrobiales bacterium]